MIDSLRNIFQVGELRNRVLFTLGMLAVYRIGNHIPTPGREHRGAGAAGRPGQEHDVRPLRHVLGTEPVEDDDLRAGHHALHQRVDHPAAADGRLAVPRAPVERGRARPSQDHAVHAVRDDFPVDRPGRGHRALPRAPDEHRRRPAARVSRRVGLPAHDDPHADDGLGPSSCGSASRSPSAASATACRSSSSPASSSASRAPC